MSSEPSGEEPPHTYQPIVDVDASGQRVSVTPPVQRVVSLVPSITESIHHLGAADRLFGRTEYCIHPAPMIFETEEVGGTKNPNIERIVELAPDLVLANREENREPDIKALREAGLNVHVCEPRDPEDAMRYVAWLGSVLDELEEAAHVVLKGEQILHKLGEDHQEAHAADMLRMTPRGPVRAAALIWREPWMIAGGDTYISGVMKALGAENAFGDRTRYDRISLDELAEVDPDVILLPSEPFEFSEEHAEELRKAMPWARATRYSGIKLCNGEDLMWFGTRTPDALIRLRPLLRRD